MANFQMTDAQKSAYTVTEFDGGGVPITSLNAGESIGVTSDNAAVSVAPDATPAAGALTSGFIVANSPSTGVSITATLTHADGSTISDTKLVDVTASTPNTLVLSFATPVAK